MSDLMVQAIDPARLVAIRANGHDEQGNPLAASPAEGWEPLRCCLRFPAAGEQILLISYAAFTRASPWREVGPVFIHAAECEGYTASGDLPAALRTGPRVLRPYLHSGAMAYDHIALVGDGEDLEPALRKILGQPEVDVVHVRAAGAQCFTYAVSRGVWSG